MAKVGLHALFKQFRQTFDHFAKIKDYRMRQDKMKSLEVNFRKFQSECVKINNSYLMNDLNNQKDIKQILQEDSKLLQVERLQKTILMGLIRYYHNQVVQLRLSVECNSSVQLCSDSQMIKENPYDQREQGFFVNQSKKKKINLNDFL